MTNLEDLKLVNKELKRENDNLRIDNDIILELCHYDLHNAIQVFKLIRPNFVIENNIVVFISGGGKRYSVKEYVKYWKFIWLNSSKYKMTQENIWNYETKFKY